MYKILSSLRIFARAHSLSRNVFLRDLFFSSMNTLLGSMFTVALVFSLRFFILNESSNKNHYRRSREHYFIGLQGPVGLINLFTEKNVGKLPPFRVSFDKDPVKNRLYKCIIFSLIIEYLIECESDRALESSIMACYDVTRWNHFLSFPFCPFLLFTTYVKSIFYEAFQSTPC